MQSTSMASTAGSTPSNRKGMRSGMVPNDSMETLQRRLNAVR
jgi:hypothetical protein